jgi:phosphoribosylglycinamide formyltransferase 1
VTTPARLAVLASGGGTNLQALIDHFRPAAAPAAEVALVVGSRPGIGALERAAAAGIEHVALGPRVCGAEAFPGALLAALERAGADLVVLAGYLQLVPQVVVERYRGRILNIHPALLPAFGGTGMYGAHVHRAVIAAGARVSGATVHLVDERYDEGRILAQWPVPVLPDDTPESLAARVLRVEHLLLPMVVEALVRGPAGEPLREPVSFGLEHRDPPSQEPIRRLAAPAGRPTPVP